MNDRQWARIEPHLPTGLTGPDRDDDRRIISGIVYMLQSGARWRDCPREYGPYRMIYDRFNRWAKRERWCAIFQALLKPGRCRRAVARLDFDQSSSVWLRRKRGEHNQAIGRSRGGRTTKIHALSDPLCRPVVLHLTPGQDADIAAAPDVLALAPPMSALLADKGYDGENLRPKSLVAAPSPSFPINPTVSSFIVSTDAPTEAEMSSNATFGGSRTSAASPHDTTSSPGISWPLFSSPLFESVP
ncbi:IS5 family transposase [Bradyrhizobium cosmicum]|uniref:IS5 family transposase n=1 Tax=Bradyrhizobium cosmicum TaxID=1404864 RepID=UPI0028E2BD2A|nr:IS5 family transposase [Bradyrhizobium cosmicum]